MMMSLRRQLEARATSPWRGRFRALLLLAAMLVSAPVRPAGAEAQAGLQADREAAQGHFERGVELYHEGNLDAALVEFERAYELYPSYKLLFNLAQLQVKRHEYVTALQLYRRYLEDGQDRIASERRQEVESELSLLETRVASLWVKANVEDAELVVNGARAVSLPLSEPIMVNAGLGTVRVSKPGYRPARQRFKAAGGDRLTVTVSLVPDVEPVDADAALDPRPAASSGSVRAVDEDYLPFWVSLAATAALAGAATTFGVLAMQADDDLGAALARVPVDPVAVDGARTDTKTFALLSDGLAIAAVLGAGLTLYLMLDPPVAERERAATAGVRIRLVPAGVTGQF